MSDASSNTHLDTPSWTLVPASSVTSQQRAGNHKKRSQKRFKRKSASKLESFAIKCPLRPGQTEVTSFASTNKNTFVHLIQNSLLDNLYFVRCQLCCCFSLLLKPYLSLPFLCKKSYLALTFFRFCTRSFHICPIVKSCLRHRP